MLPKQLAEFVFFVRRGGCRDPFGMTQLAQGSSLAQGMILTRQDHTPIVEELLLHQIGRDSLAGFWTDVKIHAAVAQLSIDRRVIAFGQVQFDVRISAAKGSQRFR